MKIWYARVSTNWQSLEIQKEKLTKFGCEKIFEEKKSGADKKRQILNELMDFIREGDELIITRLDRLARSVFDLNIIVQKLQKKKAGFVVLDQQIDTTTPTWKLMFHILSALAEFERELINERVRDGIEKAKRKGVKLWRKPKLTEEQVKCLQREFESTVPERRKELAEKYGIGRTTMYRLITKVGINNEKKRYIEF